MKFTKSSIGLYYHEIRWENNSTVLINIVADNKAEFKPILLKCVDAA